MFTGIIEAIGEIVSVTPSKGNLHLTINSPFTKELKIDQSVAHNGVCLTVVDIQDELYTVTAIEETLSKTNLSSLKIGDNVNLERGMKLGDRLDGHLVQGHVDQTGVCVDVSKKEGSWIYTFEYDPKQGNMTIDKGSITVNGVSLTVAASGLNDFSVAIIPYTYEHTNFNTLQEGDLVNLEFDVIGKYVTKLTRGS